MNHCMDAVFHGGRAMNVLNVVDVIETEYKSYLDEMIHYGCKLLAVKPLENGQFRYFIGVPTAVSVQGRLAILVERNGAPNAE